MLSRSYYCLPTLQSEKTWFKQIQNKLLKNYYQPCISLWDKNYFFPVFTEHMSFLSCHIISSEYLLEALKGHLNDVWSDVHLK